MKKTETKSTVLLAHHLKSLRMPTILAECEKVATRCAADNERMPYGESISFSSKSRSQMRSSRSNYLRV